ncbi:MAG: flagellar basal body rod protein FlgB [Candidatus Lindowbacteria bacterium]|nr:flagellar basal body rod protein FlgB [Candidatus Lindowbacteria bacterium]
MMDNSYITGLADGVGARPMGRIENYDATALLERALPILEASNRILANNVANANTPGFTPTHISFRESLERALTGSPAVLPLKVTHPRHIVPNGSVSPELALEHDSYGAGRNDESKFDIDKEMVALLKNSSSFDIFSGMLTKRYQQMREVLRSA